MTGDQGFPSLLPYPYPVESQDTDGDDRMGQRGIVPTRAQVAAQARAYIDTDFPGEVGLCLKFSRTCAMAPGGIADATAAWQAAVDKHRTSNVMAAPAGTFHWWSGGSQKHGHVAVALGNGKCVSTDVLRKGHADVIAVEHIAVAWGLTYLGWTGDINGVHPTADIPKEWDEMATEAEVKAAVKEVVEGALTADNAAFMNAVRVAIEAERAQDAEAAAKAVWGTKVTDPTDQKVKTASSILAHSLWRAQHIVTSLKGHWS